MKTKDFIKLLQEADPKGEGHIRLGDGVPFAAEAKPGYYDGSYSYLEDDMYIVTTKGYKVDIYCLDMTDVVLNNVSEENYNDIDLWEKSKSKIKFDFTGSNTKANQELIESYLNEVKINFDELITIYKNQTL